MWPISTVRRYFLLLLVVRTAAHWGHHAERGIKSRDHHHHAEIRATCTGTSTDLDATQCAAWMTLYDELDGDHWKDVNNADLRNDPCSCLTLVTCSDDGASILELHLGNRGLSGEVPDAIADLTDLRYLMLAHNNLAGAFPAALNYLQFADCGFGEDGQDCCYLTALVSGVYDTANETGVTNFWDCPLPDGAETVCHAACADWSESSSHRADRSPSSPLPLLSPSTSGLHLSKPLAVAVENFEAKNKTAMAQGRGADNAMAGDDVDDDACQQCVPASIEDYPQCDVDNLLIWDHISAAYCTEDALVVWANAVPNHAVRLAEIPKPPGSGPETNDFPVRLWNTQSYTYRLPLNPVVAAVKTNYSGAGAVAMMLNGVSMYPILEPGEEAIDLDKLWEQGHDSSINMKLDQQLDHCNEHAGRGFDIHYHADPVCMYDDVEEDNAAGEGSPIIGYAADGFPVYGKFDSGGKRPEGLDRCNGHDNGDGYHYHTSTRFPYTVVCWNGVMNESDTFQPGGQPGQYQWAITNARSRSDWDKLLPCCDASNDFEGDNMGKNKKTTFGALPARLAKQLPTLTPVVGSGGQRSAWMFQSTAPKPRNTKIPKTTTTTTTEEEAVAKEAAGTAYGACVGNSSALVQEDCEAWQDLFDATGGATAPWVSCSDLRLDPCGCLTAQGQMVCGSDGSHVTALALQANGLTGTLPASLANMEQLTYLNVAGNHHSLPHSAGLGGVLPEGLLWDQYVGCGLEGNMFDCPIPDAALRWCADGQPIGCVE